MGNCFSEPKKSQPKKITLAIFGLDNAGKTSVVKVLQGGSQSEVAPTVGFSTNQLKWKNNPITLLDVGGGARIRDIWKNYFAESHGYVYVVDASNRERLAEATEIFSKVLTDQRMQGKPVLLLLNKQDLLGAINEAQAAEQMQLEPLVNANKCPCRVEAMSATHGAGKQIDPALKEGFNWLVKYINERYEELTEKINRDMETQRAQLAKEKEERMERIRKAKEEREARGEYSDEDDLREKPKEPKTDPEAPVSTQNGHVNPAYDHSPTDKLSNAPSQTSHRSSMSNGLLPPLNHELGNRSKRKVRPSSAGQESATLTSSFQASVIPHLPPIVSPPQLKRPSPRLPNSIDIPPPATPPPTAIGATPEMQLMPETPLSDCKVSSWTAPSFPLPPSFTEAGLIAMSDSDPQKVAREDSTNVPEQAARRKRRKRRLQRFNLTAPISEIALRPMADANGLSESTANPAPTVHTSPTLRLEPHNARIPSIDHTISNASSLSVTEAFLDKVPSKADSQAASKRLYGSFSGSPRPNGNSITAVPVVE